MVEPRDRLVVRRGDGRAVPGVGLEDLSDALAGGAAEYDEVDEAVRAEPVGAVNRHACRLADREQAGHDRIRIAVLQMDDLAVIVRGDAAHIVMDRRRDGERLARQIDAGEDLARLGDAGEPLVQHLGIDVVEVEVDMILVRADPAAFAHLGRHRA